jgi:galactose mutarotase-like enzyme
MKTFSLTVDSQQQFNSPEAPEFSCTATRLTEGVSDGVMLLTLENGPLTIRLVPTRGMAVWDMTYEGIRIGWDSPVRGPVHPSLVPVMDPGGLGWLEGFDELLARCGLVSNGAPDFDSSGVLRYPLHGRIGNLPARNVEISIDASQLSVTGIVDEVRFHFGKLRLTSTLTTTAGQKGFRVIDKVENRSGVATEIQLLYHVNFGAPVLAPGSRVMLPADKVVPRDEWAAQDVGSWDYFGPPTPGMGEQVYFFQPRGGDDHRSTALLQNAHRDMGVALRFDTRQLPCFSLWKNTPAMQDGYVTGLEPGTNFPNPRSFEQQQGRTVKLGPGESTTFELSLDYLAGAAEVSAVEQEVTSLLGEFPPGIHETPQLGWCVVE